MNTGERITRAVQETFQPLHCELHNESHMHAGPATESHYKLVLVSEQFRGKSRVRRHQAVYATLQEELQSSGKGSVHALALHLFSPEEWQQERVPDSPLCAGKNK